MNIATKLAMGVSGAVALASGIYYGTREPTRDVGDLKIDGPAAQVKVIKTKSGKQVRIVTPHQIEGQEQDTEFGKTKVIDEDAAGSGIPGDALCNILFEATIVKKDGRDWPDVEGLDVLLDVGVTPVLINADGDDGIWNCLFRGPGCAAAVEKLDYIGSDIQQFINHPKRSNFLKTHAKATATDKNGYKKGVVKLDDADADPEAEVFVNHGWLGMGDVNFSSYRAGVITSAAEKAKKEREGKKE